MNELELAERCEQATGSDIDLNREITIAIGLVPQTATHGCNASWWDEPAPPEKAGLFAATRRCVGWMDYTASLDAAMTLVPEGWAWRIENWPRPDGQSDIASDDGPNAKAVLMECEEKRIGKRVIWGFHTPGNLSLECRAATPALALCAAALRVRAAR